MQTWQILPVVLVVGVALFAFFMRGKAGAGAQRMFTEGIAAVTTAAAAHRQPGETEPACIMATTRTTFSAKVFFLALTDRRLFVAEAGQPVRAFERASLSLDVKRKTWTDVGNMQTTTSEGWEARAKLPDGESHVWRIYGSSEPGSHADVMTTTFLRSSGAA